MYGLGLQPSPPDARDHILSASAIQSAAAGVVIPDVFAVKGMPPHLDQNGYPHCTAYAGNQAKRWQEKRDGHGLRQYDQAKMYRWQKQLPDGIPGEGSTGKAWCEVARKKGIPLKGTNKGVDKIAGYWRVDIGDDIDALLAAIVVFGPVMMGCEWPKSWLPSNAYQGVVPPPSGGMVGGHETLIVGYNKHQPETKGLALIDWGSWGNYPGSTGGGNVWIPVKYLSTHESPGKVQVWEMWKTKDIVGD